MRRTKSTFKQKSVFFIVTAVILIIAALAAFGVKTDSKTYIRSVSDIRFGIDINGGVSATFKPAVENYVPTAEELESAKAIIETRLDGQNILDRNVTVDSTSGSILVEFPWAPDETEFDPAKAIKELGETAELSFWHVKYDEEKKDIVKASKEALLTGADVKSSSPAFDSGKYFVTLEFNEEGAVLFEEATRKYKGEMIGIYMDDTLISSPTVNVVIPDGKAIIEGDTFTLEEVQDLATKINAGALPFSMTSTNYNSISADLGEGALNIMINSGIIAFILICLFMILYYRLPGVVACINLTLQVAGQFIIFSSFGLTLTLSGIAGIILAIGMGVDSSIIISETIKDELRNNKTVKGAVAGGFSRAFQAVLDCNITTAIVAVLLIIFGTGSMLSFGYTLIIGIVMNFCLGIMASKLMMNSLTAYKALNKPWLYGAKKAKGGAENV